MADNPISSGSSKDPRNPIAGSSKLSEIKLKNKQKIKNRHEQKRRDTKKKGFKELGEALYECRKADGESPKGMVLSQSQGQLLWDSAEKIYQMINEIKDLMHSDNQKKKKRRKRQSQVSNLKEPQNPMAEAGSSNLLVDGTKQEMKNQREQNRRNKTKEGYIRLELALKACEIFEGNPATEEKLSHAVLLSTAAKKMNQMLDRINELSANK